MTQLSEVQQFLEQVPLFVRGFFGFLALAVAGLYYLAKRPPWWYVLLATVISAIAFALAVSGVIADRSGWGRWRSNTHFFMYMLPGVASTFIWAAMRRDFSARVASRGRRHRIRTVARSGASGARRVRATIAVWRSARPLR